MLKLRWNRCRLLFGSNNEWASATESTIDVDRCKHVDDDDVDGWLNDEFVIPKFGPNNDRCLIKFVWELIG